MFKLSGHHIDPRVTRVYRRIAGGGGSDFPSIRTESDTLKLTSAEIIGSPFFIGNVAGHENQGSLRIMYQGTDEQLFLPDEWYKSQPLPNDSSGGVAYEFYWQSLSAPSGWSLIPGLSAILPLPENVWSCAPIGEGGFNTDGHINSYDGWPRKSWVPNSYPASIFLAIRHRVNHDDWVGANFVLHDS